VPCAVWQPNEMARGTQEEVNSVTDSQQMSAHV